MGCVVSSPSPGPGLQQAPVQPVMAPPRQLVQKHPAPAGVVPSHMSAANVVSTSAVPVSPGKSRNGTVSQDVLERYLALENEIAAAEKCSPKMVLQQKKAQMRALATKISEMEIKCEKLEETTKQDIDMLDQILNEVKEGEVINETVRENMAQQNAKEIALKELNNLREQEKNLANEISELEEKNKKLSSLYDEQAGLLDQIFGGSYGSDLENRLEHELDQCEQMRNNIVEANFKWRQAQLMVDYAQKQLAYVVKKWSGIIDVPASNLEGRYNIASEVRNNLVAAVQNIRGAQRYLSNVAFPYCAPAEVETLSKATSYIFTDMQTDDRHAHALECYTVTMKRCGALLQWLNQVVTQTISKDLDEINAKVKKTAMALRRERCSLIKSKVKEVLGKDVDIQVQDVNTDVHVNLNIGELALTDGIDPNEYSLTDKEMAALAQHNDGELAPLPSKEEVFGEKVEELTNQFKEDDERIAKQLQENKGRQTNNLQEKLAERRQRRARQRMEERELKALQDADGGEEAPAAE